MAAAAEFSPVASDAPYLSNHRQLEQQQQEDSHTMAQ